MTWTKEGKKPLKISETTKTATKTNRIDASRGETEDRSRENTQTA